MSKTAAYQTDDELLNDYCLPNIFHVSADSRRNGAYSEENLEFQQQRYLWYMSVKLLKECVRYILTPLDFIINSCLEQAYYPQQLKEIKDCVHFQKTK